MVRHKLLSEMHPQSPSTATAIGGHTLIMAHTAAAGDEAQAHRHVIMSVMSHFVGMNWPVIMQVTVPYQALP